MKQLMKNYTTEIPVERTMAEIQKLLADNGARGIALEYDGSGTLKDIFFKIRLHEKELPFRLPAKPEKVYAAVFAGMQYEQRLRHDRMKKAEAIAWRICKTWLEAQITLINLEQAKLEEVFLPYLVMPSNKTLFETMEHNQFLLPDKRAAS
jgi:tRNA nucleotidyltransferase/poly(A) polymerase